jgi:ParB/RepB/Spo0J family partition protein
MSKDFKQTGMGLVPIEDIVIGARFRDGYGDIDSLMFSIDEYGQLEPIIISDNGDGRYLLIAGGRRIHAFKKMGRTEIEARLWDTLDELRKAEVELELDVQRSNLTWAEEAKATEHIVELKRAKHQANMPSRFGRNLKQKEIAEELNISEATMSEILTVARGLKAHPELEFQANSRRQAVKMIREESFDKVLDGGQKQLALQESFLVATPMECLGMLENETADMIILDPDKLDSQLLKESYIKLKPGGSVVVFAELIELQDWTRHAEQLGFYTIAPSIWHVKNDDVYQPFVWFGKHRERPLRLFPPHISCARAKSSLHLKAKPYNLMMKLIKSCTERGAFVLVPECYDIETLKVCLDIDVNIRAACNDKMLRDKLIINS